MITKITKTRILLFVMATLVISADARPHGHQHHAEAADLDVGQHVTLQLLSLMHDLTTAYLDLREQDFRHALRHFEYFESGLLALIDADRTLEDRLAPVLDPATARSIREKLEGEDPSADDQLIELIREYRAATGGAELIREYRPATDGS